MRVKEESEKSGLKLNIQKTKIMESHPITSWWTEGGKVEAVTDFIFFELQNHCRWQPYNKKILVPWKVSYDKPRKCIKKQRNHFADKGPSSQNYGFSSSHILMWELDHKEELMFLNCGAAEDSWESLGLQGDLTSWSYRK